MINPWYTYIFAFLIVLLCYSLSWSELYPYLTWTLILFLLITFIISFVIGWRYRRFFVYKNISYDENLHHITFYIYVLWIIEFIYAQGIPLLRVISGEKYDYTQFGIPFLHLFVVTFSSFFTVYSFHVYISTKKSDILIIYLLNLLPALLIFNRAMLLINLASSLFVYFIYFLDKNINFIKIARKVSSIVLISLLVLFGFGILGNIRTASQYGISYSNRVENLILEIGGASKDFFNLSIPIEYFWVYIYISSPLANLQTTLNEDKWLDPDLTDFIMFINTQLVPDLISNFIYKTIFPTYDIKTRKPIFITDELNVSTVYAGSYVYLSWLGIAIMATFVMSFPLFYISFLSKKSRYYVTGIAILNSLYLFLIFQNMFSFSGVSLQLLYPLLFQKLDQMKLTGK